MQNKLIRLDPDKDIHYKSSYAKINHYHSWEYPVNINRNHHYAKEYEARKNWVFDGNSYDPIV